VENREIKKKELVLGRQLGPVIVGIQISIERKFPGGNKGRTRRANLGKEGLGTVKAKKGQR